MGSKLSMSRLPPSSSDGRYAIDWERTRVIGDFFYSLLGNTVSIEIDSGELAGIERVFAPYIMGTSRFFRYHWFTSLPLFYISKLSERDVRLTASTD